jgi:Uma2 family endonuclease
MAEVGILADDMRFELLDGEIVEVHPLGNRHAALVSRLNALFVPATARRAIVRVQDPVLLGTFSAPQPDLALVRYDESFHESRFLTRCRSEAQESYALHRRVPRP